MVGQASVLAMRDHMFTTAIVKKRVIAFVDVYSFTDHYVYKWITDHLVTAGNIQVKSNPFSE